MSKMSKMSEGFLPQDTSKTDVHDAVKAVLPEINMLEGADYILDTVLECESQKTLLASEGTQYRMKISVIDKNKPPVKFHIEVWDHPSNKSDRYNLSHCDRIG